MKRWWILAVLVLASACAPNYSNGSRIGVVTKLSEKGLIFKSWEGEMLVALPIGVAGNTNPETFVFNVDPNVVPLVTLAMVSGVRVELVYHEWAVPPLSIDNSHVVVNVKAVAHPTSPALYLQ